MRPALLLTLALVLPLVPIAHGDARGDCDAPGNVSLGVVTVGPGRADSATIYFDDRNYLQGNGLWIYAESNHEDFLQRGGSSIVIPDDNEICIDDSEHGPDTLVM